MKPQCGPVTLINSETDNLPRLHILAIRTQNQMPHKSKIIECKQIFCIQRVKFLMSGLDLTKCPADVTANPRTQCCVNPSYQISSLASWPKLNYLTEFAITLQQSEKTHHHQLMHLISNAELRSSNQVNQFTQHYPGNDAL